MSAWRRIAVRALPWVAPFALLVACGGGSDQAPDSQNLPDAAQLEGAACADCRAGYLSGVAATGGALADAEVRIVDAQGRQASGRTDAQGRYDILVTHLAGPLVVQVTGLAGGQPVRLHSACRGAEIGNRAVNVTPLTELLVAQALGGRPAELLRDGRVDFFRLDANTLRQAEMAVEALVLPVLQAAGVAGQVDLRVTPFRADTQGLDLALGLLALTPAPAGYRLRHVAMAEGQELRLTPGALAQAPPLPPLSSAQAQAAAAGLAELRAWLADWSRLFEQGLPDAAAARSRLSDDFLDGGLPAAAFVDQVLLRDDAVQQGGYSLRGARWNDARLLAVAGADALRLRVRVSLPAPWAPHSEDMWWARSGGTWRLRGDQAPARAGVRNLAVLGPRALEEAAVRALPGVACPAAFDWLPSLGIAQRCHRLEVGTSAPGLLDFGVPGDGFFGTLSFYRSAAETPAERLQDHLRHSQVLAAPSQRIERHLAFELDTRRTDPRAVLAVVSGPGLPAAGLRLQPPPRQAGAPAAEHWVWAGDSGDDWQAVPLGWCEAATDSAEASACAQAWRGLSAGADYRFELFDAAGRSLGHVTHTLPDSPLPDTQLAAQAGQLFARFDLAGQPALQPSLALLLAGGSAVAGDALALQLPWLAPGDARQRVHAVQVDWWRATPGEETAPDLQRWRAAPAAGAAWAVSAPARPALRTRWLAARLTSEDPLGNRYVHFVAPHNPY